MWSLNAPRAHTLPFALHTAVFHLNSSVNFESASLITLRKRAIVLPRQPVSPAICLSICLDALIPNSFFAIEAPLESSRKPQSDLQPSFAWYWSFLLLTYNRHYIGYSRCQPMKSHLTV